MKNNKLHTGIMITQIVLLLVLVYQVSSINYDIASLDVQKGAAVPDVKNPSPPEQKAAAPSPSIDMAGLIDDDPYKGADDAPVTIIEWSDFECPFCGRFYSQTLDLIEKNYVETGKVKFVYRDFPLSFHEHAQKSAEAGECADEQGMFWEMHDTIFENQQALSTENLKIWASEIGLDSDQFNNCLDSGKYASEVQKDMQAGSAAGIRGTPGFIINGRLLSGAQPYASFEAAIEEALR